MNPMTTKKPAPSAAHRLITSSLKTGGILELALDGPGSDSDRSPTIWISTSFINHGQGSEQARNDGHHGTIVTHPSPHACTPPPTQTPTIPIPQTPGLGPTVITPPPPTHTHPRPLTSLKLSFPL